MKKGLIKKISDRKARIAIIGMGYVGLPLAVEFARVGFKVTGIDLDVRRVNELNKGKSYILDVPSKEVKSLVTRGKFRVTNKYSCLVGQDIVIICVPTPLRKTKEPDISYIVHAAEKIAAQVNKDKLIVLESTTYPGTTKEIIQPLLQSKGLKAGRDFYLAFSPERVDPANKKYKTRDIPKVVGGVTKNCTNMAKKLYSCIIDEVITVSSTDVAEMVKLLENTFRSVNIGLVNELALMCYELGIDTWEVIQAAGTKPFGFMPFYPGPGLGGHCIPIDPF
ncbi:MAG: nucleotide sugar dehydrogenase, partial [Candidatus Omnitrophica bacterium]|nr:nucleotide sugar dehydrogenase [Candidatus Omnitrophota bacterium]